MSVTPPSEEASDEIRTRACPHCPLCRARGEALYDALRDRRFGAPGQWRMVRCPDPACGLLWLDPMPLADDIGKAYRSYYTHGAPERVSPGWKQRAYAWMREGYLSLRFGYPASPPAGLKLALGALVAALPDQRAYLDMRVMQLRVRPGGRLLDVGCGSGRMLLLMRDLGWSVEGVDFDPRAVESARGAGLTVHLGALEDQHYAERSFDSITMNHVIEHVPDPLGLLRESHRILAPGGQLTIATPNATSLGHARFGEAWRGLEPPRHLHVFSPGALASAVARAGFTRYETRTTPQLAEMIYRESVPRPNLAGALRFKTEEYLRILTQPSCGEEVVVIAHRDPESSR